MWLVLANGDSRLACCQQNLGRSLQSQRVSIIAGHAGACLAVLDTR